MTLDQFKNDLIESLQDFAAEDSKLDFSEWFLCFMEYLCFDEKVVEAAREAMSGPCPDCQHQPVPTQSQCDFCRTGHNDRVFL